MVINRNAFWCSNILTINIPENVNSIGDFAFGKCLNLKSIKINNEKNSVLGEPWGPNNAEVIWLGLPQKINAKTPTINQDLNTTEQNYILGDTATTLEIVATADDGGNITYQWYKGNGTVIDGQTSNTFTPPTNTVGTEKYYCIVTNTNNSATGDKNSSVKSDLATITVKEKIDAKKPVIIEQPYSYSILYVDEHFPFEVKASSPDDGVLSYQWYRYYPDTRREVELIGEAYSEFIPKDIMLDEEEYHYFCKITNTNSHVTGNKTAFIDSDSPYVMRFMPNFKAETPTIEKNLSKEEQVYNINDKSKSLEVIANVTDGGELSYQWFKEDGSKIEGETSNNFTPKTTSIGTEKYYCEITNTWKSSVLNDATSSVKSNTATITVKEKTPDPPVEVSPVAPVITKNLSEDEATYTLGDSSNELEVEATVSDSGTLSYQWFANDVELPGEISNKYTPSTKELGTSEYYCQVTNTLDGKTAMAKSNTAIITVKKVDNGEDNKPQEPLVNAKVPVITKDLDKSHIDTTVNKGSIDLDIEAESQDDGVLSYQWLKDGNIIDNETKESLTIDTSQTGTHLYKCLVTNTLDIATGDKTATISSKTVSITVEPKVSEPSNNRKPSRPSKPIDENTTEEKTTDEPVDEIIEIILPNPDSDTTEVPGTEKDYIYGKDKDGNIFEVEHHYDRNKKVHIIKILSDYFIIKSSIPLETTTENPMLYKEVINTGAIDTTNNFSFCSKFVNHFCLDGIKKSIKFYLTK